MSKKGLIILIICFLIIALAVGAGLFILWGKVSAPPSETKEKAGEMEIAKKEDGKPVVKALLSLETFVVNLADPGGKRYLRVSIAMEIDDKDYVEGIKKKLPQIRDKILMIIPTKKFKDVQTSLGKDSLRNEIIAQLNPLLDKGEITNLYFQEFVVQ